LTAKTSVSAHGDATTSDSASTAGNPDSAQSDRQQCKVGGLSNVISIPQTDLVPLDVTAGDVVVVVTEDPEQPEANAALPGRLASPAVVLELQQADDVAAVSHVLSPSAASASTTGQPVRPPLPAAIVVQPRFSNAGGVHTFLPRNRFYGTTFLVEKFAGTFKSKKNSCIHTLVLY
jgi:hypothetical protein